MQVEAVEPSSAASPLSQPQVRLDLVVDEMDWLTCYSYMNQLSIAALTMLIFVRHDPCATEYG